MTGRFLRLACVIVMLAAGTAAGNPPPGTGLSLAHLPEGLREEIRAIVEKPTLAARGPIETFPCRPDQYFWLLDHPDRAVVAWRRLGAKCVSITDLGNGLFGWADDQSSKVTWQTLYKDPEKRLWFAQGKVRPGPLLPLIPVRVVVLLHHRERPASNGPALIQHRTEMYVHTDSKTAALVTKMLGASAPRMAEQGLGQLQMFFSALCAYLERNPKNAENLLRSE